MTGHLFFLCLLVLAVYFWKERLSLDAARVFFEISDSGFFHIDSIRPLSLVSQVFPLLGIWCGVPLNAAAILYSTGDVLWYYGLFLWLGYGLESRRGMVTLLLILSLTMRYSFFAPASPLLQGLALIPVWLSLLHTSFRFRQGVLIAMALLIIFSHPVLFFPLAFAFVWWSIGTNTRGQKNYKRSKLPFVLWPSILLLAMAKLSLPGPEQEKLLTTLGAEPGPIEILRQGKLTERIGTVFSLYPLPMLLMAVTAGIYLARKKAVQAFFLVMAVMVYICSIGLFVDFDKAGIYHERLLLPIAAIIGIGASGTVFLSKVFIPRLASLVLLVLILLLHLDVLRLTADSFQERTRKLTDITVEARKSGIRKAVIPDSLAAGPLDNIGRYLPLETMVLSSLSGPDSTVTVALRKVQLETIIRNGKYAGAGSWLKNDHTMLSIKELNTSYYRLPADPYLPLTLPK